MNKLNNKLFYINQRVYFIENNKVKRGIITKIINDNVYASRFKCCWFQTLVYPWCNCFLTKELPNYTLYNQQHFQSHVAHESK